MGISRNARAAVAYLIVSTILVVYDMTGMLTHPAWGSHIPALLMKSMPILAWVIVPLVFILTGFSIANTLNGERRGAIGVLLLGILALAWNIMPGVWRLEAGFPQAAATCGWQIVLGAVIIYNSAKVLREHGAVTAAHAARERAVSADQG